MNKGYISKIQFEAKRQAYLGQQEQLRQMEAQKAQLTGELRQANLAISQLPIQTAVKVNDMRSSKASLNQKRIEHENSRAYIITAPVTGRVSTLQIALGASVTSQLPLMSIVSDGAKMEAELYAPSRAIGFARPGQEVRLMYDAFPFQRFGSFSGHIVNISRTILAPSEINAPISVKEPVYRVRVILDKQVIKAFGEYVALQPGMTLQANIVLDRRTFFDWLMEPINAVRNRT
jgi:membrane fusion protein